MSKTCVINVDLADVWAEPGRNNFVRAVAWGDEVDVVNTTDQYLEIETVYFNEAADGSVLPVKLKGYIEPTAASRLKPADVVRPLKDNTVLKINFIDVQQGDGAVIESPDGKIILVDGGINQMFARYLAGRFRGTSPAKPQTIDCIVVTHGDADHFSGLVEIFKSETNRSHKKRLFMRPRRYYHNGLVKRPGKIGGVDIPELQQLGAVTKVGANNFVTGLEKSLLTVPDEQMNEPFLTWKNALRTYDQRGKITFRRLAFGDKTAFSFFNKGDLRIDVLGPLTTPVAGKPALRFLGEPPSGPRMGHESLSLGEEGFSGNSASHTINGHSVVFRLSYGGFSYLFAGDLNDEASRFLVREHNAGKLNLRSDVFKVPHHGSADFSGALLQAVSPLISVVSSGDENARFEYIHPRATLIGALGKFSRVEEPLIFVTEMVAFFKTEGWSRLAFPKTSAEKKRGTFFGFSRGAFGAVKTRTDGKRLLVYTDSALAQKKEAYAYALDGVGVPQPAKLIRG